MFERLSFQDLDTKYLVRAIGISMIVANHASFRDLHGGLNLLLILSGMSFAQVCLTRAHDQGFALAAYRFVIPFAVASVTMAAFWGIYSQEIRLSEIAMLSNWFTTDRISWFPVWYSQAFLQFFAILIPLLWLCDFPAKFQRSPVHASLLALAVAIAIAVIAKGFYDTTSLADRLPHLYAWNFVLGWLY